MKLRLIADTVAGWIYILHSETGKVFQFKYKSQPVAEEAMVKLLDSWCSNPVEEATDLIVNFVKDRICMPCTRML